MLRPAFMNVRRIPPPEKFGAAASRILEGAPAWIGPRQPKKWWRRGWGVYSCCSRQMFQMLAGFRSPLAAPNRHTTNNFPAPSQRNACHAYSRCHRTQFTAWKKALSWEQIEPSTLWV